MDTKTKALFLIFHGMDKANGISKKINYQVQAIKNCGLEVKLCHYYITPEGNRGWMSNETLINQWNNSRWSKLKKRIYYKPIITYARKEKFSFVYIRSDHNANPFTINLVKQLKTTGAKVVMEVPTYPYDHEYNDFNMKCDLFIDRIFRKTLAKKIDRIVTFSDEKKIFGQTTINISNGIDFSSITMKTHINNTSKSLHFIGVAEIHYWHGFDRFLKGMHLYYQTPVDYKIYFHIVGSPTAEREQKEIIDYIKEKYLEEYVILHGRQYGTELDKLFDLADIGVGSLARHRTQIDKIKPLKNREYAARGIPFIFSETDADFENMPYIYKIPADESPVSIKDILTFFRKMNLTPSEIRNSISNLSWNKQMEKVIKEVNIKL